MRKTALKCRILALVLCATAVAPSPARAVEPVTVAAVAAGVAVVGKFLVEYAAGKFLDEVMDTSKGKLNPREFQQRLEELAQQHQEHSALIYDLKKQINQCATREEMRQAVMQVLRQVDSKMADHAARLYDLEVAKREHARKIHEMQRAQDELYRQMGIAKADIAQLQSQVTQHAGTLSRHGQRLTVVEGEVAELKRWNNAEVAERLAVAGDEAISKSNYPKAIELLTQAHAYAPEDPGIPYVLGMAYYMNRDERTAALWVAKGIAAERLKAVPKWFANVLPRYQGGVRTWLDGRRYDPVLGVKSTGEVRVAEATDPPASPGRP